MSVFLLRYEARRYLELRSERLLVSKAEAEDDEVFSPEDSWNRLLCKRFPEKYPDLYVKIDYSPAWTLNEKVIDFIFFSDKESREKSREKSKTFERISKYNNVRAEAYVMGKKLCALEDTGFSNVDQIMDKLVTLLPKKVRNTRVQFKITNVDKNLTQMYQRLVP